MDVLLIFVTLISLVLLGVLIYAFYIIFRKKYCNCTNVTAPSTAITIPFGSWCSNVPSQYTGVQYTYSFVYSNGNISAPSPASLPNGTYDCGTLMTVPVDSSGVSVSRNIYKQYLTGTGTVVGSPVLIGTISNNTGTCFDDATMGNCAGCTTPTTTQCT